MRRNILLVFRCSSKLGDEKSESSRSLAKCYCNATHTVAPTTFRGALVSVCLGKCAREPKEREREREREHSTEGGMQGGRVGLSFRKEQQKAAGNYGSFSQG